MRKIRKPPRQSAAADAPVADINTTPLIDVMLVLLIMLIITIPVQLHAVNLNMPTASAPPSEPRPEVLHVDVSAAGVVAWNGEPLADRAELVRRMEQLVAQPDQPPVYLRPDRKAKYEVVAAVLAAAQRAGLTRIGIVGSQALAP
ncbi:outer membrane transport energization protein ExbD [Variovorax sp. YR266]|uniref:ExbD/TolR family protein n=1 Tax=Variovorax sp. YR266 TaxID=1884386 RepID=UPI00089954A2|nr:biopolymer transporter ExbD [Variovorax sp. YR266]SDZ70428.1 outer membrane transport energization protein ExbD [Variovorax sp. YR266]